MAKIQTIQLTNKRSLTNKLKKLEDEINRLESYIPVLEDALKEDEEKLVKELDKKFEVKTNEIRIGMNPREFFEKSKVEDFEKLQTKFYWKLREIDHKLQSQLNNKKRLAFEIEFANLAIENINKAVEDLKSDEKIEALNPGTNEIQVDDKHVKGILKLKKRTFRNIGNKSNQFEKKPSDENELKVDEARRIDQIVENLVTSLKVLLNYKTGELVEIDREKETASLNFDKSTVNLEEELDGSKDVVFVISNLHQQILNYAEMAEQNEQELAELPESQVYYDENKVLLEEAFDEYDLLKEELEDEYLEESFKEWYNNHFNKSVKCPYDKVNKSYMKGKLTEDEQAELNTLLDEIESIRAEITNEAGIEIEQKISEYKHIYKICGMLHEFDKKVRLRLLQEKHSKRIEKVTTKNQEQVEKTTEKRKLVVEDLEKSLDVDREAIDKTIEHTQDLIDNPEKLDEVEETKKDKKKKEELSPLEQAELLNDQALSLKEIYKNDTEDHLMLSHLTMQFGGLKAVDDLSFSVKRGEIFGLIGPNGAGKTTVFNCITQFYKATKGLVFYRRKNGNIINLMDYPVHGVIDHGIVRTFQNVELIWELSVLDNLLVAAHSAYKSGFFAQLLHLPRLKKEEAIHRARALQVLEDLELIQYKDVLPIGLPYGILKRIELARTLMLDPELIILDEPAAGLNEAETRELAALIRKIRKEYNVTIFLVEHDMSLVMDICDRICAINFGKMLSIGTPEEIQAHPDVQEAYLGGE